MSNEKSSENLIFSPISIEVALALGYFATTGETRAEIGNLLDLHGNSSEVERLYDSVIDGAKDKYQMKILSKIWVDESLKVRPRFQRIAKKSFNSEVSNGDFTNSRKVAGEINKWVAQKTNNKIQNIISEESVNQDTLLVLLNAVYFKSEWEHLFKLQKRPGRFWNNGENMVEVLTMSSTRNYLYGYLKELNSFAIEIPYKNNELKMMMILPREKNGLQELEDKLNNINFMDLMKTRMTYREVKVILPKFTINNEFDLVQVLSKIGVNKIFVNSGDFGGLFESPRTTKVSSAKHSVFIDVNETGTEAAAATSE